LARPRRFDRIRGSAVDACVISRNRDGAERCGEPLIVTHGTGCRLPDGARRVYRWLIRLAMNAAPKPLSMFTTETPDAQLLSMPRSAARPPKLAPYPTLVGTAMTGAATNPAITLGSAPSIPATATTARADSSRPRSPISRWIPATPTSY